MNQLTVMLNGATSSTSGASQAHAHHQQQYYTFQTGQGIQSAPIAMTDQSTTPLPTQQLVTFQQSQSPQQQQSAVMLAPNGGGVGGSQAYSTQSSVNQGTIQYFLTPSLVQQHTQLVPQQQQQQQTIGIMPNLISSGVNMIPVQSQQIANSTSQFIQSPLGSQLQPTFVTMTGNGGTFQLQPQTNSAPAIYHQQAQSTPIQLIGAANHASLANSAILSTNQLIGQSGQFIVNQTIPTNSANGNLITPTNPPAQQIYQLVLSNGQVIQTMQPATNHVMTTPATPLPPPPNASIVHQPTQHTAISVPIQNGQMLASNLTMPGQTFITTQQPQANSTNLLSHSIIGTQPYSGNMFNVRDVNYVNVAAMQNSQSVVMTPPSSSVVTTTAANSVPLNQMVNLPGHSTMQLYQSPVSAVSSSTTTTMMVLSQSIGQNTTTTSSSSGLIPDDVLDQKSIKCKIITSKPIVENSLKAIENKVPSQQQPKVSLPSIPTEPTNVNETNKENVTTSGGRMVANAESQIDPECVKTETPSSSIVVSHSIETQTSIEETKSEASPDSMERPSRPSTASSCGSLKIAEDEEEDDTCDNNNEESVHSLERCDKLNYSDIEQGKSDKIDKTDLTNIEQNQTETLMTIVKHEDKEGYQSSYGGSPCHFTDTEDEEEEEEDEEGNEEHLKNGEIKLLGKNGLSKAVYNLINNRILSSEEDNATNASMDSKCSSLVNEELCAINGEKLSFGENPDKILMQVQTSAISSPLSVQSNCSGSMEPESTTQNAIISSSKEKTISNTDVRVIDGVNVDEIKEFAKKFKLCRLSLGLTQSQVGQELSALNGPCYSQSAICRFEKLDVTPNSAKKIKPVLENWMRDAEEKYRNNKHTPENRKNGLLSNELIPKINGIDSLANNTSATLDKKDPMAILRHSFEVGKKRKRRTSFTPIAMDALNQFFEKNQHPSSAEITEISEYLNYDRDVVRVWFCNRRQSLRAKKQCTTDSNPSTPELKNNNRPSPIPVLANGTTLKLNTLTVNSRNSPVIVTNQPNSMQQPTSPNTAITTYTSSIPLKLGAQNVIPITSNHKAPLIPTSNVFKPVTPLLVDEKLPVIGTIAPDIGKKSTIFPIATKTSQIKKL